MKAKEIYQKIKGSKKTILQIEKLMLPMKQTKALFRVLGDAIVEFVVVDNSLLVYYCEGGLKGYATIKAPKQKEIERLLRLKGGGIKLWM